MEKGSRGLQITERDVVTVVRVDRVEYELDDYVGEV